MIAQKYKNKKDTFCTFRNTLFLKYFFATLYTVLYSYTPPLLLGRIVG